MSYTFDRRVQWWCGGEAWPTTCTLPTLQVLFWVLGVIYLGRYIWVMCLCGRALLLLVCHCYVGTCICHLPPHPSHLPIPPPPLPPPPLTPSSIWIAVPIGTFGWFMILPRWFDIALWGVRYDTSRDVRCCWLLNRFYLMNCWLDTRIWWLPFDYACIHLGLLFQVEFRLMVSDDVGICCYLIWYHDVYSWQQYCCCADHCIVFVVHCCRCRQAYLLPCPPPTTYPTTSIPPPPPLTSTSTTPLHHYLSLHHRYSITVLICSTIHYIMTWVFHPTLHLPPFVLLWQWPYMTGYFHLMGILHLVFLVMIHLLWHCYCSFRCIWLFTFTFTRLRYHYPHPASAYRLLPQRHPSTTTACCLPTPATTRTTNWTLPPASPCTFPTLTLSLILFVHDLIVRLISAHCNTFAFTFYVNVWPCMGTVTFWRCTFAWLLLV